MNWKSNETVNTEDGTTAEDNDDRAAVPFFSKIAPSRRPCDNMFVGAEYKSSLHLYQAMFKYTKSAGNYEGALCTYLDSIEDYQENRHDISDEDISVVNREWDFAFSQWGYEMLSPQNTGSPALHVGLDGVGSS